MNPPRLVIVRSDPYMLHYATFLLSVHGSLYYFFVNQSRRRKTDGVDEANPGSLLCACQRSKPAVLQKFLNRSLNRYISKPFDPPSVRWATGHRGVDITAETGAVLIAPDDGVISFNGTVAGKDVISIKHADGLTSTFEPAHSDLETGDPVFRGQPFGVADGLSDHCLDFCVHWGVMDASDDYLDPSTLILPRTTALKPVQVGD